MSKILRFGVLAFSGFLVVMLLTAVMHSKFHALEQAAEPYQYSSVKDRERQLMCMTQNIYYEAASEPPEGKLAVGQVVMNRVESGRFGKDPCQVIFQKNVIYEKVICQFSWACEGPTKTKPVRSDLWRESADAAKMVLMEGFRLPSLKNALYYHADYINPKWPKEKVAQIGRHIFYKDI